MGFVACRHVVTRNMPQAVRKERRVHRSHHRLPCKVLPILLQPNEATAISHMAQMHCFVVLCLHPPRAQSTGHHTTPWPFESWIAALSNAPTLTLDFRMSSSDTGTSPTASFAGGCGSCGESHGQLPEPGKSMHHDQERQKRATVANMLVLKRSATEHAPGGQVRPDVAVEAESTARPASPSGSSF